MERDGYNSAANNNFEDDINHDDDIHFDQETPLLSSNLVLDHVGEVVLSLNTTGLSWKPKDEQDGSCCFRGNLVSRCDVEIAFSDIYAVELNDLDFIHRSFLPKTGRIFLEQGSEMYRFTVYGIRRSETQPSHWLLAFYTFGHKNMQICQMFVDKITTHLEQTPGRPKNLLVFVHPCSGECKGQRIWETVSPIFSHAQVRTKVTVTERAGHAFDVMASMTDEELSLYDGVIAVGGDGFFNEILNGLLSSRLKAPHPHVPPDFFGSHGKYGSGRDLNETSSGTSNETEDQSPLLASSRNGGYRFPNLNTKDGACNTTGQDVELCVPNKSFRFGIIPAGSTDAIVICTCFISKKECRPDILRRRPWAASHIKSPLHCEMDLVYIWSTTGTRDPITSALHIVLGKRVRLDITQVVKWKTAPTSKIEPCICYTASFTGYGFYGDVIQESEKYRWMGPKRYDFAGTKVFLRHRSYDAELSYLVVESEKNSPHHGPAHSTGGVEQAICQVNCKICNSFSEYQPMAPYRYSGRGRWLSTRGQFLSIGAAVITCRNDRAPDGLVADAHLSDGYLHLILIKKCSHHLYLRHLMNLARKGGQPLDFEFVEHHKTPAFAFTSFGRQSVWNLDGELVEAHKLSAQVFRGLINLFAAGPEV